MYRERVLLRKGFVLEVLCSGEERWALSLRKGGKLVLEYRSDAVRDFKSVEQLRYEFERDVENALRQD